MDYFWKSPSFKGDTFYGWMPVGNQTMIEKLANEMLDQAISHMKKSINKALECEALDTDSWDKNHNPMILPKIIFMAVLENEAEQYKGKGTSFEKEIKKEVKNLKIFL